MEYSDSSHEPEHDPLCSWLSDDDLNLIGELGLPDAYHWGNLQDWTEKILIKYRACVSDSRTVRQRFIRTRCVACRRLCEDPNIDIVIDPPVALPCGHIMGWTCYADYCDNYTMDKGPPTCPWTGPSEDEPKDWSPACNERIVHDCEHPSMSTRIPALHHEFYLPQTFFTPPGGFVTNNCRDCTVQDFLVTWTQEARQKEGVRPDVFAACGALYGTPTGERRPSFRLGRVSGFERLEAERTKFLEDLFATTAAPTKDGVAEDMSPEVLFLHPVLD